MAYDLLSGEVDPKNWGRGFVVIDTYVTASRIKKSLPWAKILGVTGLTFVALYFGPRLLKKHLPHQLTHGRT